jgi:hypothetical protein
VTVLRGTVQLMRGNGYFIRLRSRSCLMTCSGGQGPEFDRWVSRPGAHRRRGALSCRGGRRWQERAAGRGRADGIAGGFRVLRADGAELETGLSFPALHRLLMPLRGELEQVNADLTARSDYQLGNWIVTPR